MGAIGVVHPNNIMDSTVDWLWLMQCLRTLDINSLCAHGNFN